MTRFHFNGKSCPAPIIDGKVKLRVLADRASMELYANDGLSVASSYEFEVPQDDALSISANKEVEINLLEVNELTSMWKSRTEPLGHGEELKRSTFNFRFQFTTPET